MSVRVCPICDIADCATHRPSTLPAVDPAAIREAALREAADVAVIHYYAAGAAMRPEFMPTRFRDAILALIGEKK
jgi:hypothetical protein